MDRNKLEISGSVKDSEETQPLASYKAIPEADMEDEGIPRSKDTVKVNGLEPDGADEKLLASERDVKISPMDSKMFNEKASEKDKQNGDAKLDISDLKSACVGLTKEELMKYANDPFWIRIRWFLFITFWLLWTAMLVGAIVIIYVAPKCNPPPPKTWWEKGPLSEIKYEEVQLDELSKLKDEGITGVIVDWPEDTYNSLEDTHGYLALLKKANEIDLKVIVGLEPGTSGVWFNKSENNDGNFSDYYIWEQGKFNKSGVVTVPNNWISELNRTSWIFSVKRGSYYYAPKGTPHLNFRNPNVTLEFTNVLKKFAEKGAGGFRLKDTKHLLVDPKFTDNPFNSRTTNLFATDYLFYIRQSTEYSMDLGPLLKQWRTVVKEKTDNGPFMVTDDVVKDAYSVNNTLVVDLPADSHVFNRPTLNVTSLVHDLGLILKINKFEWPLWTHTASPLPSDTLDIVTYLLPGVPLVHHNASLNKELLKMRESPAIMRGTFNVSAVANRTMLAVTMETSGSPGTLVGFNPTDETVLVDFPSELEAVSEEVTIQLLSKNFNETGYNIGEKHSALKFPISGRSAVVFAYMPKKNQK